MNDQVGQPPKGAQQLGNYRLVRLLGQGGFADVYLGEHIHLRTRAAIKVLQMRLAEDHAEAFIQEARTIAHLVHPNIVRVLDFGVQNAVPFLVMDYAPGGTLRRLMQPGKPLPPAELFPFVVQVASALQYAHNRKLIHRDIKPENMLVGVHGEVLLSDFGLALVTQSSSRATVPRGDMSGTAVYMSPEQVQGHPRTASDQYALAVVVYEWLTGTRPFQGTFLEVAAQQVLASPQSLRSKVPTISLALEEVVMRALAKEPQQRFPSVQDFATALAQVCQQEGLITAQTAQSALATLPTSALLGASPLGSASQLTFLPSETNQGSQSPFATTPARPSTLRQFMKTPLSQSLQSQESETTIADLEKSQPTFIKTPPSLVRPVTPPDAPSPIPSTSWSTSEASLTRPQSYKLPVVKETFASQPLTTRQTANTTSEKGVKARKQAKQRNIGLVVISLFLVCVLVIGSGGGMWYFTRHSLPPFMNGFGNGTGRASTVPDRHEDANPYAPHTGKLAFNDSLNRNQNNWDDGQLCNFRDGSYHLILPKGRFATCYAQSTDFRNFTYEVQMTFLKMGHTSSAAGIAFRGDDAIPAAYIIEIYQRGKYSFLACSKICRVVAGYPQQPEILPAFHTGAGQHNTLAVVVHDDSFTFYVNGQKVFGPMQDHTSSHGMVGVYAQGGEIGDGSEIAFSPAKVWQQ